MQAPAMQAPNMQAPAMQARWGFYLSIVLLAVNLQAVALGAGDDSSSIHPDILLIMPDQMRGDCLSVLNHPVLRTPTMDRLRAQGTLFRRAYSTVPSCIPARFALLTGMAPQASGVVGFKKRRIDCPTLPQLLQDAGYATALVGREMHQLANDSELGFQICVSGSTYVSDDQYALEVTRAFPEVNEFRSWVGQLGLTYNHWQAKPWPLPEQWHPTSWIVQKAVRVIEEVPKRQPLFLTASFYAPHPPLFPPKPMFEDLLERDLPKPAHGDWVDWSSLTPEGTDGGHRVLLGGTILREAQAGYFGLIEHLDQQIAQLIKGFQMRSQNAGRPWLIIVTSDHGEMLGDHGFFRKCEPFEGSANIPMIIAGSADLGLKRNGRSLQPVCLEDLLPTLCELAHVITPPVSGVSLTPILRGEDAPCVTGCTSNMRPATAKIRRFTL